MKDKFHAAKDKMKEKLIIADDDVWGLEKEEKSKLKQKFKEEKSKVGNSCPTVVYGLLPSRSVVIITTLRFESRYTLLYGLSCREGRVVEQSQSSVAAMWGFPRCWSWECPYSRMVNKLCLLVQDFLNMIVPTAEG